MRKMTEEKARRNIRPGRAGGAWYLGYADKCIRSNSVLITGVGKWHKEGFGQVDKWQLFLRVCLASSPQTEEFRLNEGLRRLLCGCVGKKVRGRVPGVRSGK